MSRPTDWSDIHRALVNVLAESTGQSNPHNADRFIERLEHRGLTILPLSLRRAADLFGQAVLIKTTDGYDTVDPTTAVITTPPHETP